MPQSNDAELTELYTTPAGVDIEDNEPNTNGTQPAATSFDLQLEGVAGSAIGNSLADYDLLLTCIDDTLAEPNLVMSPSGGAAIPQDFSTNTPWKPAGQDFTTKQTFSITVAPNVTGHTFHYEGSLVSANRDIVSFIKSNDFILV